MKWVQPALIEHVPFQGGEADGRWHWYYWAQWPPSRYYLSIIWNGSGQYGRWPSGKAAEYYLNRYWIAEEHRYTYWFEYVRDVSM